MPAPLSSLLGAPWAIAGSFGVHGALVLVAFAAHGAGAAPVGPTLGERVVDVDVVDVAPPDPIPLAPAVLTPPIPPPVPPSVATEPQVRATQLHPLRVPVAPNVGSRATGAADSPAPPAPQEAAPALTADEGMPHFTIPMGAGSAPAYGAVSATGAAPGTAREQAVDAPLSEQGVSSRAHLVHNSKPPYPSGALADRVEGDVVLELVVSTSGSVDSVRVLEGAGHGFDAAAVTAAQSFRFSPATKDGRPVRVRMRWPVQFRLQ